MMQKISPYMGWVIGLFSLSIVGPYLLGSIASLLLMLLFIHRPNQVHINLTATLTLFLIALLAIGIMHSSDMSRAISVLQRQFTLVVLAALLLLRNPTFPANIAPMRFLTFGNVLFSAACLVFATIKSVQSGSLYDPVHESHFVYNNFIHQNLTGSIGLNAVYLAASCSLSLLWLLPKAFGKRDTSSFFIFIYLFGILLLCKSVIVTMAFSVAFLFLLSRNVYQSPIFTKHRLHITAILVLLVGWVAITKLQDFSLAFSYADPYLRPLQIRLGIWTSAVEQIILSPWIGYGTGDSRAAIVDAYSNHSFQIGLENGFNAHNQFLELWLQVGVLGPLTLVSLIVWKFRQAVHSQAYLVACAVIILFMLGLTESILLTFRGVIFFGFCMFLPLEFDHERPAGS